MKRGAEIDENPNDEELKDYYEILKKSYTNISTQINLTELFLLTEQTLLPFQYLFSP